MSNIEDLLTPEEVARRLKIGRTKVYGCSTAASCPRSRSTAVGVSQLTRSPHSSPASWRRHVVKKQRERRRRGDGSVTVAKRDERGKPILWKASISLGLVTIDGKRRRHRPTEYATSEAEAHQLLRRLQAQHLLGDDLAPNPQTVEAFLTHRFLPHIKTNRSAGTYEVYESRCPVHIIPAVGSFKLRSLKTAHCQTLLDELTNSGLAPSMVRSVRAVLVRALTLARKWGALPKNAPNVAADTEIAPVIERKPIVLSDAQLDRLLDVIQGDPLEPLVIIALGTGVRIGEALGILWADIDRDRREIQITGAVKRRKRDQPQDSAKYELVRDNLTKTKDERVVPVSPTVDEAFQMLWQRQQRQHQGAGDTWEEQGLVFTDDRGGPLDPRDTSRRFKALAEKAGAPPGFTFHGLRHSCAAFLIKQGEHQRTIMEILGHRNLRTAQRYGTVLPGVTRDALDKHSQRLNRRGSAK
jgi:integrase